MSSRSRLVLELSLLASLAGGLYFARLTALPLRGEETRRATVAVEILDTGDWIVPRQQGEIYVSRPPAGSWPMAALGLLRGGVDEFAVRAPTAAAVVLTVLLIYWYARPVYNHEGRQVHGLPGCGAFCAAAGFAGMLQVLRLGRVAETEGAFTFLVAASLLVWHGMKVRGAPAWAFWLTGYALAGLAGLTKGPQGPVAFVAGTWGYCLLKREWRTLLCVGHLVGLLGLAGTAGLWQTLYVRSVGWEYGVKIWRTQSRDRFDFSNPARCLAQWTGFPWWVAGCTLPASLFVPALLSRKVRGLAPAAGDAGLFCGVSALLIVLPVWVAPEGNARYVMPCYPLIAVLGGYAVEGLRRAVLAARASGDVLNGEGFLKWARLRNAHLAVGAAALPAAALTFVAASSCAPRLAGFDQPAWLDGLLLGACAGAAFALWRARAGGAEMTAAAAWGLGAVAGVAVVGVQTNVLTPLAGDPRAEVAAAVARLEDPATLVSVGPLDHVVRYYLRELPQVPAPLPQVAPSELPAYAAAHPGAAFAVNFEGEIARPVAVPFDPVRAVPVGRNLTDPHQIVLFAKARPVLAAPPADAVADRPPAADAPRRSGETPRRDPQVRTVGAWE